MQGFKPGDRVHSCISSYRGVVSSACLPPGYSPDVCLMIQWDTMDYPTVEQAEFLKIG